MVEGRNTGIPTIWKAMAANGSPSPVYETDQERSYLTVILPVHKKFIDPSKGAKAFGKAEKLVRKRRTRSDLKVCVLDLLGKQEELSASEIVKMLGYKGVSTTLKGVFKELVLGTSTFQFLLIQRTKVVRTLFPDFCVEIE